MPNRTSFVTRIEEWEPTGPVPCTLVHLFNGRVLGVNDETIVLYPSRRAFDNTAQPEYPSIDMSADLPITEGDDVEIVEGGNVIASGTVAHINDDGGIALEGGDTYYDYRNARHANRDDFEEPDRDDAGITQESLIEDAINAACKAVQDRLGQTDGGIAGTYFSSTYVREGFNRVFRDYVNAELAAEQQRRIDHIPYLVCQGPTPPKAPRRSDFEIVVVRCSNDLWDYGPRVIMQHASKTTAGTFHTREAALASARAVYAAYL